MNQLSLRVLVACALTMSATHIAHATAPSTDGAQKTRPPITKKQRELTQFNDYDKVRDRVYKAKPYVNHDDSVASRKSGEVPVTGGSRPDTNLNPINCKHPAYASLCDDIKKIIGSGSTAPTPPAPKWHTIYNSSGTRYLNPPDQYSSFRIWYKYEYMKGRGHTAASTSASGTKGKVITIGSGGQLWYYCASQWQDKTAVSFTVGNTVSVPAATSGCPDAAVRNIYVTRMDVFY
ncbi:hypothetical protein L1D14_03850 [Vibrio tubiashii]|uniref:hypothetical protein n=1 Tax=Vibrio tubiashii TaxID=29498 RepID=UPI001EFE1410|nr:hypothetical protein [Vibrio tubiashii]MCG9575364.1 hypothetical protein [Vibrio tubiashii]